MQFMLYSVKGLYGMVYIVHLKCKILEGSLHAFEMQVKQTKQNIYHALRFIAVKCKNIQINLYKIETNSNLLQWFKPPDTWVLSATSFDQK